MTSTSNFVDGTQTPGRDLLVRDAAALAAYLRGRLRTQAAITLSQEARLARAAGVLAPLYAQDGHPWLLFTVRSVDLATHKGEISFPGGSRDVEDASLERTALREAHEELGLDPALVEVLGPLPAVFTSVSNFLVTPYVGWLGEGRPALTPNPAEVAEVLEAPFEALADEAIYHSELWERGGRRHTVHFYDFGAYRIWGATARMLYSLLALLPAA